MNDKLLTDIIKMDMKCKNVESYTVTDYVESNPVSIEVKPNELVYVYEFCCLSLYSAFQVKLISDLLEVFYDFQVCKLEYQLNTAAIPEAVFTSPHIKKFNTNISIENINTSNFYLRYVKVKIESYKCN